MGERFERTGRDAERGGIEIGERDLKPSYGGRPIEGLGVRGLTPESNHVAPPRSPDEPRVRVVFG